MEKHENIGWPYRIPLKSLTDHTSLWLTDFPWYDHRKKIGNWWHYHKLFFCMVFYGAYYDLHVWSTRDKYINWILFLPNFTTRQYSLEQTHASLQKYQRVPEWKFSAVWYKKMASFCDTSFMVSLNFRAGQISIAHLAVLGLFNFSSQDRRKLRSIFSVP